MARLWRAIQKIIQVSTTTAPMAINANVTRRASPLSDPVVQWMPMPSAVAIAIAPATPAHTGLARSSRWIRRRYAKTMAMTRVASKPSRSMIRNDSPNDRPFTRQLRCA